MMNLKLRDIREDRDLTQLHANQENKRSCASFFPKSEKWPPYKSRNENCVFFFLFPKKKSSVYDIIVLFI